MFSINALAEFIENSLNQRLSASEQLTAPFRIYTDAGELTRAYRVRNDVYKKRFGVLSVSSSNTTPLGSLEIYNASATVEIPVNVDEMTYDEEAGDVGEYAPVKFVRNLIDSLAVELSSKPAPMVVDGVSYSVVPVFTISNTGAFSVQPSELGKIVPLSFNVAVNVVETGVNTASIHLTLDGTRIYASQIAEDMVTSSEGQTRSGEQKSTFNIQEARYALSFVIPLTTAPICKTLLRIMHNGADSTPHVINVSYDGIPNETFVHQMLISSVRLTGEIPNNAGLNVELIEADVLPAEV